MTDKNLDTILGFLEEILNEMEDGESSTKVEISYSYLCEALHATGKYDYMGYKYAEREKIASLQREEDLVTEMIADFDLEEEKFQKYKMDADIQEREMKEEFNHEFKD